MEDFQAGIRTTLVGSYPIPDWLAAYPSDQALKDATAVVFKIQEQAGIDLVVDGELYRFDVNHPDTNGMIDYFVRPLAGVRTALSRAEAAEFTARQEMRFRARPAGVVEGELGPGTLDLVNAYQRAKQAASRPLKFTVTGPHMLSRTLLDHHYRDPARLAMALAEVLAREVAEIDAAVIQLDEANITGHPEDAPWAAAALNRVLDAVSGEKAVHLCFGNYGGQTIQAGEWRRLVDFINDLRAGHVVLEMAHRSSAELEALRDVRPEIGIGLGVIDVKTTVVESADEIARRIACAEKILGPGRVRYVHPDCGFWMLRRSVADRKIEALVCGRDLFAGRK